ncbi:MAG: 2-amino-4-hydroxy-6-hydroxymethyldihydropteridine diphosphokinase [Planctomycetota bacterium]
MNRAVIGVGSNVNPERNIAQACTTLAQRHALLARSRIVETEPIGFSDQPKFWNTTLLLETDQQRDALREELHDIEREQGRVRAANKYGQRTIDLDIVVWNGQVVDEDVHERDFLRAGVREVWPDLDLDSR